LPAGTRKDRKSGSSRSKVAGKTSGRKKTAARRKPGAKRKKPAPRKTAKRKTPGRKTASARTGTRAGKEVASIPEAEKKRIRHILRALDRRYPDAHCALRYENPLELLVATILSAQCTDTRVNIVTDDLFRKYRRPEDYLDVPREELEEDIRTTGFFKNKTKNIRQGMKTITEKHGGEVPGTMEELVELGGVGRKTANVILGECFDTPGVVVDTHMKRVATRLGLTRETDPVKIEFDLMPKIPRARRTLFSHQIISHGRATCRARNPDCENCVLEPLCPRVGLQRAP
jgi:endonuclease-3